jgi:DNA-binding NarL/FixJ family response regulator
MVKILIVDDNPLFRQSLRTALSAMGPSMHIREAADGDNAFQKVNSHCPDLVFMDIQLQGESGLTLTKKIKRLCPLAVISIITNHDLPEYRKIAHQYGARYFFSKESITMDQIAELIESVKKVRTSFP